MKFKTQDTFSSVSMVVIALALLLFFASIFTYRFLVRDLMPASPQKNEQYSYHFVLIADAYDDPFWTGVWNAANARATANDAYVEWLGKGLAVDYSLAELLEIAVSAHVDGILICADGSADTVARIQQAVDAGIPVITLMMDALESNRQGYVGFNSYELGQLYGELLLRRLPADGSHVKAMLLLNNETGDSGWNIVYSSMIEAISSENVSLELVSFDNANVFSVEEAIRELVTSDEAADVLICLDPVTTMCANQAVVDYNSVGKVCILGNNITEQILSAIQKDIIQATIAVDSDKIGTAGADALLEYKTLARTSDYVAVDLVVVSSDDVDAYIASRENSEDADE